METLRMPQIAEAFARVEVCFERARNPDVQHRIGIDQVASAASSCSREVEEWEMRLRARHRATRFCRIRTSPFAWQWEPQQLQQAKVPGIRRISVREEAAGTSPSQCGVARFAGLPYGKPSMPLTRHRERLPGRPAPAG